MILAMIRALFRTMRPKQWAKNVFIFAGLVFDGQLLVIDPLIHTVLGFILFCLGSSAVYFINDLADLEQDRKHPTKKNRPLASGKLPVIVGRIFAVLLPVFAIGCGFLLSTGFGLLLLIYIALNVLYSFCLKHVPIIDVFVVASGFVLRVGAGVMLITVERFSPWLYVCTTLLALFIGFGKRRAELRLLSEQAQQHRRVLDGYTIPYLDQLIIIVSSTTIVAYSFYTFSAENLPENHLMMLTIPFVLYGIFRYIYLIQVEDKGGAPEEIVLADRPLLFSILLWGVFSVLVLYNGS